MRLSKWKIALASLVLVVAVNTMVVSFQGLIGLFISHVDISQLVSSDAFS